MARGWGEYTVAFFRNLRGDLPPGEWLKVVARNRRRAMTRGCCGNHGEPGC